MLLIINTIAVQIKKALPLRKKRFFKTVIVKKGGTIAVIKYFGFIICKLLICIRIVCVTIFFFN